MILAKMAKRILVLREKVRLLSEKYDDLENATYKMDQRIASNQSSLSYIEKELDAMDKSLFSVMVVCILHMVVTVALVICVIVLHAK